MRYYRKVIQIRAEDSPNVRVGMAQKRAGMTPDNRVVVPGVLTFDDYQKRRKTWDKVRQCVGLDAMFYEGAEVKMFPPDWLSRAKSIADGIRIQKRVARSIGIDPAEGGDKTAMAAVDEYGVIELVSNQTPDTTVVVDMALAFMKKHQVPAHRVMFDRGGGGKQHADRMRRDYGLNVQTVAFGEAPSVDLKRGLTFFPEKLEVAEQKYGYLNRRGEMYGMLRDLLDPANEGWGIPGEYGELFRQLLPLPLVYDKEGRFFVLPKNKSAKDVTGNSKCLVDLIGHSPDETDAVLLAVYGMTHKVPQATAGAA
jgi:hypothetical protein